MSENPNLLSLLFSNSFKYFMMHMLHMPAAGRQSFNVLLGSAVRKWLVFPNLVPCLHHGFFFFPFWPSTTARAGRPKVTRKARKATKAGKKGKREERQRPRWQEGSWGPQAMVVSVQVESEGQRRWLRWRQERAGQRQIRPVGLRVLHWWLPCGERRGLRATWISVSGEV